jgi:antitoxin (DNA-binding transcriptional repressor) of toxin-antitoxin stability system
MANLKTVGIKELKNNLSAYLREVRMGARILVSDRNVIIAELHEPLSGRTLSPNINPQLSEWANAGIVRLPSSEKLMLPHSPVRLNNGLALELLRQDRDEGLV